MRRHYWVLVVLGCLGVCLLVSKLSGRHYELVETTVLKNGRLLKLYRAGKASGLNQLYKAEVEQTSASKSHKILELHGHRPIISVTETAVLATCSKNSTIHYLVSGDIFMGGPLLQLEWNSY